MTIKELQEKRGNIHYQMKVAAEKARKEGAVVDSAEWNAWDDEFTALTKQIEQVEKQNAFLASIAEEVDETVKKEVKSPEDAHARAFDDYLRNGNDMSPENKAVLRNFRDPLERTTAQSTTVGKGGYTIPTEMANRIDTAQKWFGGMLDRSLCTWISTKGGGTLNMPLVDDTSNSGYLLTEATNAETSASDMDFTQGTLNAYKYTSGLVRISAELLQDSDFDIGAYLAEQLAVRFNRALNAAFTDADGSSKPKGVVACSAAKESLAKRSIAVSDLRNLMYSIDKAYRTNGTWMFHDSTEKLIRAIAMSATYNENVGLWQPSFKDGIPSTIMGKPFVVNNDMDEIPTTGLTAAKVILFGDFKKFIIREVKPLTVRRMDELFAATDQVAYALFGRYDSDLLVASTCYPIGHGYMATT